MQMQNSTKSYLCLNVWVSHFSKICLHCTWLVLLHIAEYHVKALTTMSFSHTDQTPCLSTLAFQTSCAQHHIVHSSTRPPHSGPCNKVIYCFQRCSGVERSSVSRTAAIMTLTPRSKPMPKTWASRPRPRPGTWSLGPRPVLEAQGQGQDQGHAVLSSRPRTWPWVLQHCYLVS